MVATLSYSAFAANTYANTSQTSLTVSSIKSVYDGDTFTAYLPGYDKAERVRVRGIDTPEIRGKCPSEKAAAIKARDFC